MGKKVRNKPNPDEERKEHPRPVFTGCLSIRLSHSCRAIGAGRLATEAGNNAVHGVEKRMNKRVRAEKGIFLKKKI